MSKKREDYTVDDFRNGTGYTFDDISSEAYRVYQYSDVEIRIEKPLFLHRNMKSGGHRLFDASGKSHYIPAGWKHLYWEVNDNRPHFVL